MFDYVLILKHDQYSSSNISYELSIEEGILFIFHTGNGGKSSQANDDEHQWKEEFSDVSWRFISFHSLLSRLCVSFFQHSSMLDH